ncbi:HobA family DNA replication regulator [Helicobacter pametensis]|uniref:HobA family DNA replication regulator n=1 Tax=Helicobacter pametensis TaxID=95149 RepID=UPI0004893EB9|nr:HobA family DNA replication regulator [Helicobacter pametensis]
MEKISDWMLKTIREENNHGFLSGWLEEERFKWTKLVSNTLTQIMNETSFLLICDSPREWLKSYILSHINAHKNRPFVPILDFPFSPHQDLQNIKDVLGIAYRDYAFFYIGKRNNAFAELAIGHENSFLWILDESLQDAFSLNSNHPMLDFRLLQLYKIFDLALSACIFGKISLDD